MRKKAVSQPSVIIRRYIWSKSKCGQWQEEPAILISITPALYVLQAASFGLPLSSLRMQWNAELQSDNSRLDLSLSLVIWLRLIWLSISKNYAKYSVGWARASYQTFAVVRIP